MMLLGLIWAALAPLSLACLVLLLAWLMRKAGLPRAYLLATLLVLTPVAALWYADRSAFMRVCEGEAKPVVYRHAKADSLFLNSGTANSFGMRYLQEEGFSWIEAPSIYQRNAWVRYTRGESGTITTTEIPAITARYEVQEDFSQPHDHTGLTQIKIIDRNNGELIAQAGSATFSGGRAKWVLGAWGIKSCPSAMSSPEQFNDFYHLAKKALR